MKKGFTLVEISIVLVIIGLLIGGILAAQSMIETSVINAQVRQFGQFDAMVMSFKAKYNYLPGDAPAFGGNGDGAISTGNCDSPGYVHTFFCESPNFWPSIDPKEYPGPELSLVPPGNQPISSGPEKNVPLAKLGIKGAFITASALGNDYSAWGGGYILDFSDIKNFYAILHPTQAQTPFSGLYHFSVTRNDTNNSAVKPKELLALDTKMDDGAPATGNVIAGKMGDNGSAAGGINDSAITNCVNGGAYQLQNDSYECTPLVRIGGAAGSPQ